ncbi:MAG: hypothetical protein J0L53_14670 [Spirochaetes bacterium]|nr:hypothetical protein [Spirochaetota bacterium]MBX3720988.1 hypothetical protein [Turneriella sp.]
MSSIGKKIMIWGAVMALGTPVFAQANSTSGWVFDFSANALVPQAQPAGLGGAPAVGYSARDFNIFFRPEVLIAEPGGNQRMILVPTALFEVKVGILPGFITLLPYVSVGGIGTKIKRPDSTLGEQSFALYAEGGVGAEFQMTHEISLVPRLGVASALIYQLPDSNNFSGMTLSLAIRFTLNRSKALSY